MGSRRAIEVRPWFLNRGFTLAEAGIASDAFYESNSLEILTPKYEKEPSFWNMLFSGMPSRRKLIGELYFNSEELEAKENDNWVFEVYGHENIDLVNRIAGELWEVFHVNIQVRLTRYETRYETFVRDL